MNFDLNFIKEEKRLDFLVTEKIKKLWYIQIQILKEIDKICQKHNLNILPFLAPF